MNHNASAQSLITRIEMFIQQENWDSARTYVDQVLDEEPENGYVYFLKMLVERKAKSDKELVDIGRSVTADENYPYIQLFGSADLVDRVESIENQILTNAEIANKNRIYLQAKDYVKENTVESVTKAVTCFQLIPGWKDADSLIPGLLLKIKDLKYDRAMQQMNSGDFEQMVKAMDGFKDIINWKDSEAKISECKERIQTKRDTVLTNALSKIDTNKVTEIEKAIDEINDLQYIVNKLQLGYGDYSPSIQKCEDAIKTLRTKRLKIGRRIGIGVVALCVLTGGVLFGEYMKTNSEYNSALALVEAKQYGEAYEIFEKNGFFKDSIDQKREIKTKAFVSQIATLQTTDISFGQYNGHDLKWIVLDVSDTEALLISRKVIDKMPYNESGEAVSFEDSSLYKTLNWSLVDEMFSEEEQAIIVDTVLDEPKEESDSKTDEQTEQVKAKIFILSREELEKYFDDGNYRATDFEAKKSNYWLRTPGVVNKKGEIETEDLLLNQGKGIRPVIKISLTSPTESQAGNMGKQS
ncbi:MAG: hypothetical protein J6E46_05185 [Faecalicoccus sp.]|nr:hypothetical protein [Faecalicoccus sp.]